MSLFCPSGQNPEGKSGFRFPFPPLNREVSVTSMTRRYVIWQTVFELLKVNIVACQNLGVNNIESQATYQSTSVLLLAIVTVLHFGQIFSSSFGEKKTIHIVTFCPGRTTDVKCTLTLKSRPFAPSWKIYCRRFTSSYPGRSINLSQSTV